MILEVGEHYLAANGNIIKIIKYRLHIDLFLSNIDVLHKCNGIVKKGFNNDFDLIAHIPKQLLNHLVVEVNNYHTDNEFKQMIDNVYGDKNAN